MAERPIFIPAPDSPELVKELPMRLVWNPGFAPIQKKKTSSHSMLLPPRRGMLRFWKSQQNRMKNLGNA
jgi:hypothetical protein